MPSKKNTFFGATISYRDIIARYYGQPGFARFVIQPMMSDGEKPDDDYTIVLWAVNDKDEVMSGDEPIPLPSNTHSIPANKKIYFANIYISNDKLKDLYKTGTFSLGLAPVPYAQQKKYIAFDIYNADKEPVEYTPLAPANPSPPATRM